MSFYEFKQRHPRLVMVLLLYVVVPLIIGLALGWEMHNGTMEEVSTVVVDMENSEFSRTFVDMLNKTAILNVTHNANSTADAEELIKTGGCLVGLLIPDEFSQDMLLGRSPDMLVLYDASQLAVLSVVKPVVTEVMMTMNGAYLQQIFAGKLGVLPSQLMGEVSPVNVTYRNLYNPTKSFTYYLLPGMLLAVLQVGICMLGAERGFDNRQEKSLTTHLLTILLWALLGMLGVMICTGVQLAMGLPYRSTVCGGLLLLFLYSLVVTTMGYIVGLIVPEKLFAVQIGAVLVLPTSILGGYSFPVSAMPAAYQTLAKFLPFTYMGADLRSLCLKNMEFRHVLPQIGIMCKFLAVLGLILLVVLGIRRALGNRKGAQTQ